MSLLRILMLSCSVLAAGVGAVEAHDHGLSTTTIRVESERLVATVRVNLGDVGTVRTQIELVADSAAVEPDWVLREAENGHEVLTMAFAPPADASLELRLPFLRALGREHKHHVQVFDVEGTLLLNRLIDGDVAGLELEGVRITARTTDGEKPSADASSAWPSRARSPFGNRLELLAAVTAGATTTDLDRWSGDIEDWRIFDAPEPGVLLSAEMSAAYRYTDSMALGLRVSLDAVEAQSATAETTLELSLTF